MLHHITFGVANLERSAGFYDAALSAIGYARVWSDEAAVGRDNGAPGLRPHYGESYYAAFVVDPDGYRIEAVINAVVAVLDMLLMIVVADDARARPVTRPSGRW